MVDKDVWVQPIVVADSLSHEAAIWYGALTSISFKGIVDCDEWLNSGMRKTVRRTSDEKLSRLVIENREFIPNVGATAGAPMQYGDFPALLKRMQVSGTDFPRDANYKGFVVPNNVFVLDTLTTGKATAQAAHALWMADVDVWDSTDPFEVTLVDADELARLAVADGVVSVVRDAGHTEVESGTLTAVMICE